ncbi:hypothetical protein EDD22DRAFT_1016537 [Suillus occidentalis]|nr:hypothetical protein EDD22DRAFT_1016537 [Suillus occidentalis]
MPADTQGSIVVVSKPVIREGNNNGYWKGDIAHAPAFARLFNSLLSLFDAYFLQWAIQSFLQEIQNADIAHLSMDLKDVNVLHDIHQIIEVPHTAQELLASKCTPTLSMALPAYELLQTKWTELKGTIWELAHYIEIGLDKLSNYIHQCRKTRIYALAMIINLSLKFEWMKAHWDVNDVRKAQEWTLEASTDDIILHSNALGTGNSAYTMHVHITASMLNQSYICSCAIIDVGIRVLDKDQHQYLATPLPLSPSLSFGQSTPTLTLEEQTRQDLEEDGKDAEQEMQCYEEAAALDATADIVCFWEILDLIVDAVNKVRDEVKYLLKVKHVGKESAIIDIIVVEEDSGTVDGIDTTAHSDKRGNKEILRQKLADELKMQEELNRRNEELKQQVEVIELHLNEVQEKNSLLVKERKENEKQVVEEENEKEKEEVIKGKKRTKSGGSHKPSKKVSGDVCQSSRARLPSKKAIKL